MVAMRRRASFVVGLLGLCPRRRKWLFKTFRGRILAPTHPNMNRKAVQLLLLWLAVPLDDFFYRAWLFWRIMIILTTSDVFIRAAARGSSC
jgi:hypothetical protein